MPSVIPNIAGKDGYFLIPADARTLEACPFTPLDREPSLEEMYAAIGCDTIQVVYVLVKNGTGLARTMAVIDENGKLVGKRQNAIGTVIYDNPHDVIVGNMLILCGKAVLT